ncbi:MAG: MG2 domain-containing protein, partial [Bacteroidales bacterium]|nr:MG2 domain-containing protein [Bacteroidales bacterium]
MKAVKTIGFCLALLLLFSCAGDNNDGGKITSGMKKLSGESLFPLDRGFSGYITGYTSGIISAGSVIEVRFTPEFAARAAGKIPPGLLTFEPALRGKTEWLDETTLVFTPSRLPEPGKDYSGTLNLGLLADVEERLTEFPLRFRTRTKDFTVTPGALECISDEGDEYVLHGELIASDYIPAGETESYLKSRLGRKQLKITWDHSADPVHSFTVGGIVRTDREQKLELEWNGSTGGIRRKGSMPLSIPGKKEFVVVDVIVIPGGNNRLDIVFSDPVDAAQDFEGLIWFGPDIALTTSVRSNIVSIFPASEPRGPAELTIEAAVRNTSGTGLGSVFSKQFDFSPVLPSLSLAGNGVILPSSENLIFPFRAANLKAVDLKIIKIYENNLPTLLRESDLSGGYSLKRFGIPVYSGRIDLVNMPGDQTGTWNLYTIDLADYIKADPGVLYRVELSMRRSYSLYPCTGGNDESSYENLLNESKSLSKQLWEDPDNYYDDVDEYLYYSQGFDWNDRDDPCKDAYYSPDKKIARNILASNIGIIAKQGTDDNLHVIVSDLVSAMPLNEVTIEVYDYQNQVIATGLTDRNGSVSLRCERTPFLVIAGKDRDRNYLKVNDGAALSLSSFDVAGTRPLNGINAFIYGERDVWRPGDSIYLSLFIRDINDRLPEGHPVRFELINPSEQKVDVQVHRLQNRRLTVIRTATDPSAVTGNYTARFSVGGAVFEKKVRIETIKPNRLRIELNFPDKILGGSKGPSRGTIKSGWLSGAVAGNLSTTVEYLLKHTGTVFERYRQYNFDDPSYTFYSETVRTFDSKLGDNGEASFSFDPGVVHNAPGMLNAIFTTRVAEKGGDESIIQSEFTFAPYPVFVGINIPALSGKDRMLHTDEDNRVDVVTVDESGNPVSAEVELTIYKIDYRWWWESDRENLAWYISNNVYKPVITETINTSGGPGSFTFRINRNDWGRYLIRASVPGGHSTGKIILMEWPWEYGMRGGSEGATLLSVATDKEKYYTGDEIKLSFPSPANARAIVTLENSTGILEEIRTITSGTSSEVRFKARPEMAPNIYAFVTILQPHSQSVNDMPVRLYGVVPVMVEDRNTRLSPLIRMPEELRSMKEFTVTVSEETGKAMDYTLAVVDEGLLDITGYRTPDPWGWFYSREALGVRTWDLYDLVLGAYGGTLERIFAVGGDETLIDQTANKARRFEPVV